MSTKFVCECNGREYVSQASLNSHMKTASHQARMKSKKNPTELMEVYHCECSGRDYASKATFKAHLKSERHKFWLHRKELKELRQELTRKEIKMGKLKQKIEKLEEANLALLNELASMKGKKKKRRSRKKKLQEID